MLAKVITVLALQIAVTFAEDILCVPGQVYSNCHSSCPKLCSAGVAAEGNPCPQVCFDGCACPRGMWLRDDGLCVLEYKECNDSSVQACPGDKVWTSCGTACPATCDNIPDPAAPPSYCTEQCVAECQCPPGFVADENDNCYKGYRQCPAKPEEPAAVEQVSTIAVAGGSAAGTALLCGTGLMAVLFVRRRSNKSSLANPKSVTPAPADEP